MYSVQLLLKKLKYALTRGSCVPNWYFLPTSCSAATSLSVVLKAQENWKTRLLGYVCRAFSNPTCDVLNRFLNRLSGALHFNIYSGVTASDGARILSADGFSITFTGLCSFPFSPH